MAELDQTWIAGLHLPHTNADDRLRRVLTAALPHYPAVTLLPTGDYWEAAFFNLEAVTIFQQARAPEQSAILQLANHSLLTEAYEIEKAGVGYMAKMVLLAETVEERMLYGLFTADETLHMSQLQAFRGTVLLESTSPDSPDPFLRLLAEVVEQADKAVLLFVLQVVLEGWGVSHYRRLAKECRHPALAALFKAFLQAEARHHATGTWLFNQIALSASSQATMLDILARFLFMVQVGPQSLLGAIDRIKGPLSRTQKIQILQELDTETHSGLRLRQLRSLMQQGEAGAIGQALEERGAFTPFPAHQCV